MTLFSLSRPPPPPPPSFSVFSPAAARCQVVFFPGRAGIKAAGVEALIVGLTHDRPGRGRGGGAAGAGAPRGRSPGRFPLQGAFPQGLGRGSFFLVLSFPRAPWGGSFPRCFISVLSSAGAPAREKAKGRGTPPRPQTLRAQQQLLYLHVMFITWWKPRLIFVVGRR